MIQTYAERIVRLLIKRKIITTGQKKMYQYSFEHLLSLTINIIFILLIGFLFHRPNETLIFLLCFCTLKKYTGGLHMPSYISCIFFFCSLYVLLMMLDTFFSIENTGIFQVCILLSVLTIWKTSPVADQNKKLDRHEITALKIKIKLLLPLYTVLYLCLSYAGISQPAKSVGYALSAAALLTGTGYLKNIWIERRKSNDKHRIM